MICQTYKKIFLDEMKENDPYAVTFFKLVSGYEKRYKKDLCEFSAEELRSFLDLYYGTPFKPTTRALVFLRQYSMFCDRRNRKSLDWPENLPSVSWSFREISPDPVDEIRATLYPSPAKLGKEIDRVFIPLREASPDVTLRCFLWLAYCGLSDEEIMTLNKRDVDLSSGTVRVEDRVFKIRREAMPAVTQAYSLDRFRTVRPDGDRWEERSNQHMLMSGLKRGEERDPKRSANSIRAAISRRCAPKTSLLAFNHVSMSGMFYRVYEKEKDGLSKDPAGEFEFLDRRGRWRGDMKDRYEGKELEQRQRRWSLNMLKKYKLWKTAFEIR